jgi:cytidine deaminase
VRKVQIADLDAGWRELLAAAEEAREQAYAPYSRFPVGAAVRTGDGAVYSGANIENAVYGLTACAERVALWKAVSEGEREFEALAVVTRTGSTPCGSCRQVMAEFAPRMAVLVADTEGGAWLTSVAALLPHSFGEEDLERAYGEDRGQDETRTAADQ